MDNSDRGGPVVYAMYKCVGCGKAVAAKTEFDQPVEAWIDGIRNLKLRCPHCNSPDIAFESIFVPKPQ